MSTERELRKRSQPQELSFNQRLSKILGDDSDILISRLKSATDPRLRHPLQIKAFQDSRVEHMPVDPHYYQDADFRIDNQPRRGEEVYDGAYYGYDVGDGFRRVGGMRYLTTGKDGFIEEVGFASELALDYFHYHLYGRDLSGSDRQAIKDIQQTAFDYLRSDPKAASELDKFVAQRGWPTELADTAQLAYFHERVTPLRTWAKAEGFSEDDMYLSGWFDLSFSNKGHATYSVRDSHVIRIPYFNSQGEIELWRTRNLRQSRESSHKYTSWPLDRSINRQFSVEEKLYNGWRLNEATGKTLVITEGEFKCLVATEMSGILTVGIPGITEVDETIIQGLVAAKAAEYVVVLDRDPRAKALMRVDGITDSERAAYGIAYQLQKAGAKNIRVGSIPDIDKGKKAGVDDLILAKGPQAYKELVDKAVSPREYARAVGLDEVFFNLWQKRQLFRKTLEHYENSVNRGGRRVPEGYYKRAVQTSEEIDSLYIEYLNTVQRGAFRIDQPSTENHVFYRYTRVPNAERKIAMTPAGEGISLQKYTDDIVFFQYYTEDTPREMLWTGGLERRVPFTMQEILDLATSNSSGNETLNKLAQQGEILLGLEKGEKGVARVVHDTALRLLTGLLSTNFPPDEYSYVPDVSFYAKHPDFWEQVARMPLTITKKSSGAVIAFAALATWLPEMEVNDGLIHTRNLLNLTSAVIRRPDTPFTVGKFDQVHNTIWPYWYERRLNETIKAVSELGISEDVAKRNLLVHLSSEDYPELLQHFVNKQLLTKATTAGLFRRTESHRVEPRFAGDIVLMPVTDHLGRTSTYKVIPFRLEDHYPPVLDPSFKIVRNLNGAGRHLMETYDPERQLYLQEQLAEGGGQTVFIAYNELDSLILSSHEAIAVGLNSSLKVRPEIIAKIAEAGAKELCFFVSGVTPSSEYDLFDFDSIPGYLKEIYDFKTQIEEYLGPDSLRPLIKVSVLSSSLTAISQAEGLDSEKVKHLSSQAVDLDLYLSQRGFNPQIHQIEKRFIEATDKLVDYLEIPAIPDLIDSKPVEFWTRECIRLHSAIAKFAMQKYGKDLIGVNEYFNELLNLGETIPLPELIERRMNNGEVFIHRPLYAIEGNGSHSVLPPADFVSHYNSVFEGDLGEITRENVLMINTAESRPDKAAKKASDKKVGIIAVPVEWPKPQTENPKGRLFERYQQFPADVPAPVFEVTEVADQIFQVSIHFEDASGRVFEATAQAGRKKDAEALASEQILEQIDSFGLSKIEKAQAESGKAPKVVMLERLQAIHGGDFPKPLTVFSKRADGFDVLVTIMYEGRSYQEAGHGIGKRDAENEAYRKILVKIDEPEIVEPIKPQIDSAFKNKAMRALNMPAGDTNYIGRLHYVAQKTGIKAPEFTLGRTVTDQGVMWNIQATIAIGEITFESEEIINESRRDGRQEVSKDLLAKISNYLNSN